MLWNDYFWNLTYEIAKKSKDTSRQVGSLVHNMDNQILVTGFNGFPRRVMDYDGHPRNERPAKYLWTEHAERNAIYQAARTGISLQCGILYTTIFPCVDCARGIIQSGISQINVPEIPTWDADDKFNFATAEEMLRESSINISVQTPDQYSKYMNPK